MPDPATDRFRTAAVQWDMRAADDEDSFLARMEEFARIAAADYGADLILFPEYFTLPLAALDGLADPLASIRALAGRGPRVKEAAAAAARRHGLWLVAGSQPVLREGRLLNISFVFGPDGQVHEQEKLHITPWERQAWGVEGGARLESFDLGPLRAAVQICYDVEFPEATRALATRGAELLLVPYCTDDRRGHLRVTRCAMARAVENQIAVLSAGCVGRLAGVPAANVHHAESGLYTPVDLEFPHDGIAALAQPGIEQLMIADIPLPALRRSRSEGTVTPLSDLRRDLFPMVS